MLFLHPEYRPEFLEAGPSQLENIRGWLPCFTETVLHLPANFVEDL
jgi:hypothetical protein